jgi:hypothetical protein
MSIISFYQPVACIMTSMKHAFFFLCEDTLESLEATDSSQLLGQWWNLNMYLFV